MRTLYICLRPDRSRPVPPENNLPIRAGRSDQSASMTDWAQNLRADLARNAERFADFHGLTAYRSLGKTAPTISFPSHGLRHGDFIDASYRAILANPSWARRLEKPHNQRRALPEDRRHDAMELDSSNSSDALLMNCFCYPGSCTRIFSSLLPGLPTGPVEFGVPGRVPLYDGHADRTELDMRAGTVIFESKLTEAGFKEKSMERHRDLSSVFDVRLLPKTGDSYRLPASAQRPGCCRARIPLGTALRRSPA